MDQVLLYGSFVTILVVFALAFIYSKKFAIINTIIFVAYTSYMIYGLLYKSQGGTALAWWFYLIAFLGIQSTIMLIYIVASWFRKDKESPSGKVSLLLIGFILTFWGLLSLISHYPYPWAFIIVGIMFLGIGIAWYIYDIMERKK